MKLKGVYRWKLVNKDTGEIEAKGEQENLITDTLAVLMTTDTAVGSGAYIVLSKQATPLPALEFREYGVANSNISRDTVSGLISWVSDNATQIRTCSNNFSPPGSNQTYTLFAVDQRTSVDNYATTRRFLSFIELTTPVTQTTTQYLYVEYSIYIHYSGGLLSSPVNNYVNSYMNGLIWTRLEYLAYVYNANNSNEAHVRITPFRKSSNINLIGRSTDVVAKPHIPICPNEGCRYGQTPSVTYGTTSVVGPIGQVVWEGEDSSTPNEEAILGVFDQDSDPAISRIYVHPADQWKQIFSDPSNPPSSRASVVASGTPTNKVPIIVRLQVTKTGDASDIVDETFTADSSTDELTVSQDDWAIDDIIQVSSTGTLPAPLAASTDYYIVAKSGTSPSVLLEISLTQGGGAIDITDAGTGTHTISRQNTGRYKLLMEPLTYSLSSNNQYRSIGYDHIRPMEDCNSELLSINNTYSFSIIGREGDYIYSVQYSRGASYLMICRQALFTLEASQPLHSHFGILDIRLRCSERAKGTYVDKVYIGTTDGVYMYDLASPATPTKLPITGLLETEVRDLSFDEVTEYLWAGHSTGLSRIDLSTNTATTYDTNSGPLAGLGTTYMDCGPGCIVAHNGHVHYARAAKYYAWLMKDGVGYCRYGYSGSVNSGTLRKSNLDSIVRANDRGWNIASISGITGPNTGTWNIYQSYDVTGDQNYYHPGQMAAISDKKFSTIFWTYYANNPRLEIWDIDKGEPDVFTPPTWGSERMSDSTLAYVKNSATPIDVSEGGMGVNTFMFNNTSGPYLSGITGPQPFGWTGSAWEKDNANDRPIPKTVAHSIGNGVSVAFNNAVGENWDDQFVDGELFTFVISPVPVKDNLQEYSWKGRAYHVTTKRVENWVTTAALSVRIPECPLGSSPDADFRDMDWDDTVTEIYDVTTATTLTRAASSPPGDGEYYINGTLDGEVEFHANQVGDSVRLTYNFTCYW